MNNTNNLPIDESTQYFYANGSTSWQIWNKPQNAKLISFFVIGGGAGGGSGVAGVTGSSRSGGGGGGCSAYAYSTLPAFMAPDTIYIQVGNGGLGAAQGTTTLAGGTGSISYVSAYAGTATTDLIISSGTLPAGGGAGSATAGSAGSVFSLSNAIVSQLSMASGAAGLAGGIGAAPGTSITPQIIISPGAGGASTVTTSARSGGAINAYGPFLGIPAGATGGSSGNTTPGGDGSDGIAWLRNPQYPLFFSGGAGGGSSDGGKGGKGGNGSYGCGGGGGGGGNTSGGGNGGGGNGGGGIVIITCY